MTLLDMILVTNAYCRNRMIGDVDPNCVQYAFVKSDKVMKHWKIKH